MWFVPFGVLCFCKLCGNEEFKGQGKESETNEGGEMATYFGRIEVTSDFEAYGMTGMTPPTPVTVSEGSTPKEEATPGVGWGVSEPVSTQQEIATRAETLT